MRCLCDFISFRVLIALIFAVERQDIKGTTGVREGQEGQDTSAPAEEGPHLPNSYCEIIVNDDLIYKTRVKQYSSMPYFEAGTERFIRDWRETVVRVQVRDARCVWRERYTLWNADECILAGCAKRTPCLAS